MRRLTSTIIFLIISASLAGCTSDNDTEENGGTTVINEYITENEYINETYEVINYTYIQPPIIYQNSWISCVSENNNNSSINFEINCFGYEIAAIDINHSGLEWEYSDELKAFVPPLTSLFNV